MVHERSSTSANIDERFVAKKLGKFALQFSHVYFTRLTKLRQIVEQQVEKNWSNDDVPVLQTITRLEGTEECVVLGTLFKRMKLKPRILDEYLEGYKAEVFLFLSSFLSL